MQLFRSRFTVNTSLDDFLEFFHNYSKSVPYLFDHIHAFEAQIDNDGSKAYVETCLNLFGNITTNRVIKEGESTDVRFIVDHPWLKNNMNFQFFHASENAFELQFTIETRRSSILAILLKFLMHPIFLKRDRELRSNIQSYLDPSK